MWADKPGGAGDQNSLKFIHGSTLNLLRSGSKGNVLSSRNLAAAPYPDKVTPALHAGTSHGRRAPPYTQQMDVDMTDGAKLFDGKRVLILGVANERSIAWGVAQAMHAHGARVGFTFLGEALERRVRPLAESLDSDLIVPCDVGESAQIDALVQAVQDQWGGLDVLVHSIAFASREDMEGRFSNTSRSGFLTAMEISVYSLVELSRSFAPMLEASQGNIVTMTYYGSDKVIPGYNVMGVAKAALESSVRYLAADLGPQGIRVNAISAGPIKTLAAAGGVKGFRLLLTMMEEKAPLRRNITQNDVANSAVFLCSELGAGVTGEVMFVDAGYHVLGA